MESVLSVVLFAFTYVDDSVVRSSESFNGIFMLLLVDIALEHLSQWASKAHEHKGLTTKPAGPVIYPVMPSTTAENILPPHLLRLLV